MKRKAQDHDSARAQRDRQLFAMERLGTDRRAYHLPVLGIVKESVKSAIEAVHLAADRRVAAALAVDVGFGRAESGSVVHGADEVMHEEDDVVSLSDHEDAADNGAASVTFEEFPGPPLPPGRPLKPWPDSEDHIYGFNLAGDGIHIPEDYIPYSATEAAKEAAFLSRNCDLFEQEAAKQQRKRRVPTGTGGGGGKGGGGGDGGGGGGGGDPGAGTSDEDEDDSSDSALVGDGGIAVGYRKLTGPHLYPGELPAVNHCQGEVCAQCYKVCALNLKQ